MKKMIIKKWGERWKKSSLLEKGIVFVILVCILMLIAIGLAYLFYPSFDIEHWGNFGDYFGSITGLLAFLGVLYTLLLSEKRTEEANERARQIHDEALKDAESAKSKADQRELELKKESIQREERDLFFKLLELHQQKLDSIVYTRDNDICNGIQAFDKYAVIYNNLLLHFICRYCIVNMGNNLKMKINDNQDNFNMSVIRNEIKDINSNINGGIFTGINSINLPPLQSFCKDNLYDFHKYFNITDSDYWIKILKSQSISLPAYYQIELDVNILYKAMISISNYMYEKYGYIFSQYFRNMYYVLETCNEFKSDKELDSKNEYYFKLFRAQLSRNEILLCLFNAVSDKSSTKLVKLLKENKILDDLYYKDFFYTQNGDSWKGKELELVNDILDLYLDEHKDQA